MTGSQEGIVAGVIGDNAGMVECNSDMGKIFDEFKINLLHIDFHSEFFVDLCHSIPYQLVCIKIVQDGNGCSQQYDYAAGRDCEIFYDFSHGKL